MRKVPKGMANGGKLKMVTNDKGQEVPFFAADGKGKMAGGGKTKVADKMMPKGYFKGGITMSKGGVAGGAKKKKPGMKTGGKTMKSKMNTKGGMRGGGRTNNKMNTKGGKRGGGR